MSYSVLSLTFLVHLLRRAFFVPLSKDLLRKWESGECPVLAFAEQSEYEQTPSLDKAVLLQEV